MLDKILEEVLKELHEEKYSIEKSENDEKTTEEYMSDEKVEEIQQLVDNVSGFIDVTKAHDFLVALIELEKIVSFETVLIIFLQVLDNNLLNEEIGQYLIKNKLLPDDFSHSLKLPLIQQVIAMNLDVNFEKGDY